MRAPDRVLAIGEVDIWQDNYILGRRRWLTRVNLDNVLDE
jgi:hypothetical protein